jgi:nitrate/nitrite transporter NarK
MILGLNCIVGWFNKKRGAAYGLLSTGSSLGGVVFPIMVDRLIRSVGYGWAMRTAAFLILVLLIIANFTITSRHPPRPSKLSGSEMVKPFKELGYLLLLLGMFLLTFGIFVPIDYLPVQAIQAGMSIELAQYLIAILNAARYGSFPIAIPRDYSC